MPLGIALPEELPAMTLPNVTFFPQALLPLHIFEPRYRQMLRDVLASNRLFAVAGLNEPPSNTPSAAEIPHRIASVGIVRACQKNDDGTSNLLLQGLCRVELTAILTDEPYRRVRIRLLTSEMGAPAEEIAQLHGELVRLIQLKKKLGAAMSHEVTDFLRKVDDPEAYVDLAAFSLCDSPRVKQQLLETLNLRRRLELFGRRLRSEIDALKLQRRLQSGLSDDGIAAN